MKTTQIRAHTLQLHGDGWGRQRGNGSAGDGKKLTITYATTAGHQKQYINLIIQKKYINNKR